MKKAPKAKTPASLLPEEVANPSAPAVPTLQPDEQGVALIGANGKWYEFPAAAAKVALQSGFREPTDTEARERADKELYGKGVVNELEAAGLGFVRGATFGLSDLALRKLAPDTADTVSKLKKYNPDASLAGEISSFLVPALGSVKALGTAGKVAQSTGVLQGLVSQGADGLGKIAAKIVGDNLAGQAARAGVRLGTEAAVFQAAHNLSEDALHDKELTAESILAGTGQAAILGAGIGVALPVVARGTQAIASKAMTLGPVRAVANAAEDFFDPEKSVQLFSGATKKQLGDMGTKWRKDVKFLHDEGAYAGGQVTLNRATGKLESAGGSLPGTEQGIQRFSDLQRAAGEALSDSYKLADEALHPESIVLGADPHWAVKSASQAKAARAVAREITEDVTRFSDGARKQMMQSINDIARNSPLVDAAPLKEIVRTYETALKQTGGSLDRIKALTTQLGEDISLMKKGAFTGGVEVPPRVAVLQDIRQALRDNLNYALERLQQETLYRGPLTQMAPVSRFNKIFSAATSVLETMEEAEARTGANVNVLGLRWRDLVTGAIGGGVLGGPAGVAIAVANRAAQTGQGLLWRAQMGERLQKLAWAEKLTMDGQRSIADGLRGFLTGADAGKIAAEGVAKYGRPIDYAIGHQAAPVERVNGQQKWFIETKAALLEHMSDPNAFTTQQAAQLQGLTEHAPEVAEAVLAKQTQVYAYLLQKMPKNPGVPLSLENDTWKPADYQIQDFRRVVQVARAPLTIMDDMRKGTVSSQQVDAVRTLYPKIYESILMQVREAINQPGVTVPYEKQLKLGHLFPGTVPTMTGQFIAAMQQPATKPNEPAARMPQTQPTMASRRQTESDRSEMR